MSKFWKDALERVLWTGVAAVLAAAGVYVTELPEVWIPIGTVVLTTLKTLVAKQIGDPTTASFGKGGAA
jgi:hypothetical protein